MRKIYKLIFIFLFLLCGSLAPSFAIDDIDKYTFENPVIPPETPTPKKEEMNTGEIYVKEIEILGNNLIKTEYIKEKMSTKEGYLYDKRAVSNDLNALYKLGYFTQKVRALPIKIDENNIKLRIIVEENPPVVGTTVVGVDVIELSEVQTILSKIESMPQNIALLNSAIEEIQELYAQKGYILARVVDVQDDPDGIVNLKIDEGMIQDVVIEGAEKTKDFVVARNVMLKPGTVYNENTTRADIIRLMGTQAFADVQRDLQIDPESGQYVVKIILQEQRTGRLSLGAGIDSSSGFFGSVGFGENNFRGLGQKINVNVMAGTGVLMSDDTVVDRANLQAEISFLEPYFRNQNDSLGIRGFMRDFGSYQVPLAIEKRFGGEITFAHRFKAYRNLTGSVSFGIENVNMDEGEWGDMRSLYAMRGLPWGLRDEQLQGGFFLKLTPSLTYDTRDSAVNARRGVVANLSLEEAFNLKDTHYSYGKLSGVIRKFIPAGRKSSFVLTAKGGGKINGEMPEFAAFSMGGPYSMRGFNISEVGTGDAYMMGSLEYRTPIPFIDRLTTNQFLNNIRLAAFVDGGKLFGGTLTNYLYDRPEYAITAGVGLRVNIPGLGPINLDYGIPLTNTKGADRKHGFFTFGMGDLY